MLYICVLYMYFSIYLLIEYGIRINLFWATI